MKLMETQLPAMYSKTLFEDFSLDLAPEHMDKMLNIVFTGTADVLKYARSKDKPTVFKFDLLNNELAAAAILQYFEGENSETDPGNWSLSWTFNKEDIPEGALEISINDLQTHSYFVSCAGSLYGMQFNSDANLVDCLVQSLVQLKKWLDENAKEDKEVEIEMDGVFKARVGVEAGEKVFALEADGEIKNLIKADDAIEK